MPSNEQSESTDRAEPVILCLGRIQRREFREVLPALESRGTVIAATGTADALARLTGEDSIPDLVVVAQSYPGEFVDGQIDSLRRVAPLARFVAVLGSWCEGETRSGTPWAGAVRVFWHQWVTHGQRELERLLSGRPSLWNLPPTTGDEERCLAMALRPEAARREPRCAASEVGSGPGLVEIASRHYEVFRWLADACEDRGFDALWRRDGDQPPPDGTLVLLFDAAGDAISELARFRHLRSGRDVQAIVLADFPRVADRDRFLQAGAKAVLSRPFFWDDLFCCFPTVATLWTR